MNHQWLVDWYRRFARNTVHIEPVSFSFEFYIVALIVIYIQFSIIAEPNIEKSNSRMISLLRAITTVCIIMEIIVWTFYLLTMFMTAWFR